MAPTKPSPGKFIVLEGPDGSGKSSAVKTMTSMLRTQGMEVVEGRLPGGTPVGEAVRAFFKTNAASLRVEDQIALLMLAKRHLINEVLRPALDRGAYVVCDRFTDSAFAYQWAGFSHFSPDVRRRIEDSILLYGIDVEVDVKIVLNCSVHVSLQRIGRRATDTMTTDVLDDMDVNFKRRVCSYYRDHISENAVGTTVFINADQCFDDVTADVRKCVTSLLIPNIHNRRRTDTPVAAAA